MIYLLSRNGNVGYDEYDAKVVCAINEQEARILANEHTGDEGPIWTDPDLVSCNVIYQNGASAIILESFNAG